MKRQQRVTTLNRRRPSRRFIAGWFIPAFAGCRRVPSINVGGAFFPGWLLCFVIGLFAGVVTRLAVIRSGRAVAGAPLLYALAGLAAALVSWIVIFGV